MPVLKLRSIDLLAPKSLLKILYLILLLSRIEAGNLLRLIVNPGLNLRSRGVLKN
jgi:hypothetical protein